MALAHTSSASHSAVAPEFIIQRCPVLCCDVVMPKTVAVNACRDNNDDALPCAAVGDFAVPGEF